MPPPSQKYKKTIKSIKSKGIQQKAMSKKSMQESCHVNTLCPESRTSVKGMMTKMGEQLLSSECLPSRCYPIESSHTPFSDETIEARSVK